jgi:hypothetical protein
MKGKETEIQVMAADRRGGAPSSWVGRYGPLEWPPRLPEHNLFALVPVGHTQNWGLRRPVGPCSAADTAVGHRAEACVERSGDRLQKIM